MLISSCNQLHEQENYISLNKSPRFLPLQSQLYVSDVASPGADSLTVSTLKCFKVSGVDNYVDGHGRLHTRRCGVALI
jgi:hypothetical protein